MKAFAWILPVATVAASLLPAAPAVADWRCDGRRIVYGLTDTQRLVRFRECRPERTRDIGNLWGFTGADTKLVGMDFRVQDGKLYGVGNGGGVYSIDLTTAEMKPVSQLTAPLDGTFFGVDFNPAADRLRIVSDTGQNLRHNINTGGTTLVDATLNYTTGTAALGITGAAYTNNDLDATTATTLFDIDSVQDQVAIQAPPNNGSLSATGKLGVDAGTSVGFDIYTTLDNAVAAGNRGYASIVSGGQSGFYRVSLLTGKATLVNHFCESVLDIAVALGH